jgi:uncharacterized integral membrane protein (TIGR00698 family)
MMKKIINIFPGIIIVILISAVAYFLGRILPIIGAAVFGIIIGILIKNIFKIPEFANHGINFSSKRILQLSIILLGGTLSMTQIVKTGLSSLFVMIFTISGAFLAAFIAGKFLKISTNLKSLIGTGTAICGGSAIAAVSSVIDADEHEIAYSISTIFLFNVLAVLIFPPLGYFLGMSDYGFGLFAGTAINDTSSVVAAGYTFSNNAGDFATIVKLTRTTMIIPISLIFMVYVLVKKKKDADHGVKFNFKKIFPWFILGFIGMAIINSTGIINDSASFYIKEAAKFLIVMALSAIGLKTDFRKMLETGPKPLMLGFIVWFVVSLTSLAVQFFSKQM